MAEAHGESLHLSHWGGQSEPPRAADGVLAGTRGAGILALQALWETVTNEHRDHAPGALCHQAPCLTRRCNLRLQCRATAHPQRLAPGEGRAKARCLPTAGPQA